ncbi:MAG: hypothetical protein U0R19_33485 [Bryobacteraceae bacterium]
MKSILILIATAAAAHAQLYVQQQTYEYSTITQNVSYNDVSGTRRTVEVTFRIPNRQGPLPVVIWAHGGGDGRNGEGASVGALSDWSTFTAAAGYFTVSPAFHVRTAADQLPLCRHLGIADEDCDRFNALSWDRPFDMRAIMDALNTQNQSGPLQGRIDMARIGIGGHSAGSSGTLSVAGASREFLGKRFSGAQWFEDPRPKAFIALSPSSPGFSFLYETGFKDESTSWDTIKRPVLWVTGSGDAHEQFPRGRRIGYGFLPPGDKYMMYLNDTDFGHGDFGDDLNDCSYSQTSAAKCAAFVAVMHSVILAYLDGYVQGRPQALQYIQDGVLQRLSEDIIEWQKR